MLEFIWRVLTVRPSLPTAVAIVLAYLLLVRLVRFRRREALRHRYGMLSRKDFARMTACQAQEIMLELVEMEFPKLMGFSIVFALFKTYGIPRVSRLLAQTGELRDPETASRRTADTGVLLLEFCLNRPDSLRAMQAVARMNYLHAGYLRSGRIRNEEMLYTLGVFALEPLRWVGRYEWRALTELEQCASGTFWKAMGDKMQIDFGLLPSSREGWSDGLQWLDEMRDWCERYEQEQMVPAESNRDLALAHLDVIFINLPRRLNVLGKYIVSVIVGERMRKAMMLPEPPVVVWFVLEYGLLLRKLVLRHLALPRSEWGRKKYISSRPEANGRISAKEYLSHPWYVKPTFSRRWGTRAWATRLLGRKLPGDDGKKYHPEGYLIAEVGPDRHKMNGKKHMDVELERIQSKSPGGCPFGLHNSESEHGRWLRTSRPP